MLLNHTSIYGMIALLNGFDDVVDAVYRLQPDRWGLILGVLALLGTLLTWAYSHFTRLSEKQDELQRNVSCFRKGRWHLSSDLKYSKDYFYETRLADDGSFPNYVNREDVEETVIGKIEKGLNLVVVGEGGRGKTSLMVNCLSRLPDTECLLVDNSEFRPEVLPESLGCRTRHIIVFDDFHKFYHPTIAERTKGFITWALSEGYQIVATCRSELQSDVQAAYESISSDRFEFWEVPPHSSEEVSAVIAANPTTVDLGTFDEKNVGTLFGLKNVITQYESTRNKPERHILKSIKALRELGVANAGEIERRKIRKFAEKAFDFNFEGENFTDGMASITRNEFVTDGHKGVIPKDNSFEKVVALDYTIDKIIDDGLAVFKPDEIDFARIIYNSSSADDASKIIDLLKSKNIARNVNEYNALIAKQTSFDEAKGVYEEMLADSVAADKQTFYTLININGNDGGVISESKITVFEAACAEFDKASMEDEDDAKIFFYWGNALDAIARARSNDEKAFEQACDKYDKATQIEPNLHQAFYNWGTTLDALARVRGNDEKTFEQACDKYEKATQIKPDKHQAFNNWGTALDVLARVRGNDERTFEDACDKYKRATQIKPDDQQAFYNWGTVLDALARVRGDDERTFEEACDKYKQATQIDEDFHEAFYNWGIALSALGKARDNDRKIFDDAGDKFRKAEQTKNRNPDDLYFWGNLIAARARATGNDHKIFERAIQKFKLALKFGGNSYNLACVYAVTNRKQEALETLRGCFIKMEIDADYVLTDEDWQPFLDDDDFKALIAKYKT